MTPAEITELRPPDTGLGFPAMRELRPAWTDESAFVRQIDDVQRGAGYRLIGVIGATGPAVAVAGFHQGSTLAWGQHLYVHDLSTLPTERGHGHARRLLDWLDSEAERRGCTQVHLDSGVGPTRTTAHRLYLNAGYQITSHHFTRRLT